MFDHLFLQDEYDKGSFEYNDGLPFNVYLMACCDLITDTFPAVKGAINDRANMYNGTPSTNEKRIAMETEIDIICFFEYEFRHALITYQYAYDDYDDAIDYILSKELVENHSLERNLYQYGKPFGVVYDNGSPIENLKRNNIRVSNLSEYSNRAVSTYIWVRELEDVCTHGRPSELMINAMCKLWCGRTLDSIRRRIHYGMEPTLKRNLLKDYTTVFNYLDQEIMNFSEANQMFGHRAPIDLTVTVADK